VCAFTFLTNYAIGGLSPAFYILSQEFNKTPGQTADLLLWPILVLGVFNFFWVPVANYFGKRPVFVFASLLLCVAYIWGACAKSFKSLLWSNIIAAFAGSSTEALGAAMVNDLYFLHERGFMMGLYMNSISGGNTIGPLICGFVVESIGWRWHKWMAGKRAETRSLDVLDFLKFASF
jgi:MFS family permease